MSTYLPRYDYTHELLEDVFEPTHEAPPIVVVDWKVYCHDIHREVEQIVMASRGDETKLEQLITAFWAHKLNRGPDMINLEEFCVVIVDDSKHPLGDFSEASTSGSGYWRHIEAHKLGNPEYKGGRGEKPSTFSLVEKLGREYASKAKFVCLAKPFFEADDIAGEICRIKRAAKPGSVLSKRIIYLSTLDSDWCGLVSDEHKIIWANTGPWLPRLRSETEVCDYFFRKEGLVMSKARDCYDFKVQYGDASDNLPAGTPLRLFNLYDPDDEWSFTPEETESISTLLEVITPNNRADHAQTANTFIRSHGILPAAHLKATFDEKRDFFYRAREARKDKALSSLKGLRAKKMCEKLLEGPAAMLEKCIKFALGAKKVTEKITDLAQHISSLSSPPGSATKAMLAELRATKKELEAEKASYKKRLEELFQK